MKIGESNKQLAKTIRDRIANGYSSFKKCPYILLHIMQLVGFAIAFTCKVVSKIAELKYNERYGESKRAFGVVSETRAL